MSRFRETPEFGPTINAAAETLDISPTAVEKDYWVSQVLHALADTHPDDFIFKGGTSLSKGYGIVERFSEDVDLLVLPGDRGRGAVDRLMKDIGASAAAGIGGESSAVGGAETGRHRSFAVRYPAMHRPTALIATSVLLEMGVRGGPHPNEVRPIGSLLGDVLEAAGTNLDEFEDLDEFQVPVLHPARTLLEKLVHISDLARQLASDDSLEPDLRSGRHFYDVYQLLGDAHVVDFLENHEQTLDVVENIDAITRQFFGGDENSPARPDGGFAASAAFDLSSPTSAKLRLAYDTTMSELYFGADPLPGWDEICDRVARSETLL